MSTWAAIWGNKRSARAARRFAEKYRTKLQAAADGFFHNAHAFNGAMAVGREFAVRERAAQLLHQRIVATLDAA